MLQPSDRKREPEEASGPSEYRTTHAGVRNTFLRPPLLRVSFRRRPHAKNIDVCTIKKRNSTRMVLMERTHRFQPTSESRQLPTPRHPHQKPENSNRVTDTLSSQRQEGHEERFLSSKKGLKRHILHCQSGMAISGFRGRMWMIRNLRQMVRREKK